MATTNKIARVTISYVAEASTALSLTVNSLVEIITDTNPDWWYVSYNGQAGYYPARCLRIITAPQEDPLPSGWVQHQSPENRIFYYHADTNTSQWTDPRLDVKCSATETIPTPIASRTASEPQARVPFQPPPPPRPKTQSCASDGTPVIMRAVSNPESLSTPPIIVPSMRPQSDRLGGGKGHEISSNQAFEAMINTHTLPSELKEEIVHFSMSGYAKDHFKKQKKWGVFGVKHIKPTEVVISYSKKYNASLTLLNDSDEKIALKIYSRICIYMEGEESTSEQQDRKLREVMVVFNKQCTSISIQDEVYCQLIKQTTDNPNNLSLERGWELLLSLTLCTQPSEALMRVLIGHANTTRCLPTCLGGLSLAVHSLLCHHLKSLKLHESDPITLCSFSEISYMEHIEKAKLFYIPLTIYGQRVENLILRELYYRDAESFLPLRSELLAMRNGTPEVMMLLCEYILQNGGKNRSGIFREAADVETVKAVLDQLERGNYQSLRSVVARQEYSRNIRRKYGSSRSETHAALIAQLDEAPIAIPDVLVAADLLKIWFRKMPEPITGFQFYDRCVAAGRRDDLHSAGLILQDLPPLHWSVLKYLAGFLRELSLTSHITNMEITNLSLVFAPNCIKSPSPDPRIFASNADDERRCFKLFIDILAPPH